MRKIENGKKNRPSHDTLEKPANTQLTRRLQLPEREAAKSNNKNKCNRHKARKDKTG
jgi:hypothetical protein